MNLKFSHIFCLLAAIVVAGSCVEKEENNPWNNAWNVPDVNPDPLPEVKGKPRLVWIDAAANFLDYANDAAKIAEDVAKIKETGFTHIVVDVRPTNTGVLFKSSTEHALDKVDVWSGNSYKWVERTADFDYLQTFIDEGHKQGLTVFASMNTFVGGCLCLYGLGEDGIFYRKPELRKWASVVNTEDGLVNSLDLTGNENAGAKFLSPANDEVQEYMLTLIGELASYEGLDGIILDRCRFDDYSLQSDFSDASREKFEEYLGKKIVNWPSDVMTPGKSSFDGVINDIQKSWLSFRAKVIHDFVEKASAKVHATNADCKFGVYVGGWYSSYYYSGVNWASPKYDPKADGYYWADSDYKNYGYADNCDVMIIGAYASASSIYGNKEWSMQGFCKQAGELIKGDAPYFGGPDIGNSTGFTGGGQGDKMKDIVDACINSADGLFIFDLCHVKMYDYWKDIKSAIDSYLKTVE